MEHASGTVHTCFKLQNPLQEACASIIRGVVELREYEAQGTSPPRPKASGLLSLSSECATPKYPGTTCAPNQNPSLGNPIPINPNGLQVWWARVCWCSQAPETVFPANPSPPHVQPHRFSRQNLPQPCRISTEPEFVICYQTQE